MLPGLRGGRDGVVDGRPASATAAGPPASPVAAGGPASSSRGAAGAPYIATIIGGETTVAASGLAGSAVTMLGGTGPVVLPASSTAMGEMPGVGVAGCGGGLDEQLAAAVANTKRAARDSVRSGNAGATEGALMDAPQNGHALSLERTCRWQPSHGTRKGSLMV